VLPVTDSLLTTRSSPCRRRWDSARRILFLSRITANVFEKVSSSKSRKQACWGPANITQLIRYLVALRLARGLPCVRSPRWSWAAIPHASSRVRPPTSHISTHTYSTFCLGPMNSLLCVCVCLARSAPVILAYVHIRLIPIVDASVACLLETCLVFFPPIFTHISLIWHGTSARALSSRQHSRPD
jgi:hypothetical protein